MIKVHNEVAIYEVNGKEVPLVQGAEKRRYLAIESHWNSRDKVVIRDGDTTLTVAARDLQAALANAMNTGS